MFNSKLNINILICLFTGSTPLILASSIGNIAIAQLLLQNGAEVDAKKKYSKLPININIYIFLINNVRFKISTSK